MPFNNFSHYLSDSTMDMPSHLIGSNTTVYPFEEPTSIQFWLIPCSFFHAVSTAANLALVIAVCADRTSRSGPKLLTGHMAITAFVLTAVFQTRHTYRTVVGYNLFRNISMDEISSRCDWIYKTHIAVLTAVSWSEVSLAINRAIAVGLPHLYSHFRDVRVSAASIIATWSIAGVLVALSGANIGVTFSPTAHGTCMLSLSSIQPVSFGTFLIFTMHIVPYLISVVISLLVFVIAYMKLRANRTSPKPSDSLDKLLRKRLIITKAIFLSVLWCFICLLPASIVVARLHVSTPSSLLFDWLRALTVLQYAVNPLIFFGISNAYRRSLQKSLRFFVMVCCFLCRGRINQILPLPADEKEVKITSSEMLPRMTRYPQQPEPRNPIAVLATPIIRRPFGHSRQTYVLPPIAEYL